MIKQTQKYVEEMTSMYKAIIKKYFDTGELNELDILFLQAYRKTIDKNIKLGF